MVKNEIENYLDKLSKKNVTYVMRILENPEIPGNRQSEEHDIFLEESCELYFSK